MTTPILREQYEATLPALSKPLDALTALDLLKQVVTDKGDEYVYTNHLGHRAGSVINESGHVADCYYVHDVPGRELSPGCIAGAVLHRAGVPLIELQAWESNGVHTFADECGWADEEAGHLLGIAQATQDTGSSWGMALGNAMQAYDQMMEVAAKKANQEVPA